MTAIDGVTPATDGAAAGGDPALSGHVIVYGVRGVGLRTVEHLHAAGVGTVVVHAGPDDVDPVADALLASWGVPQVTGRTREALVAARLDTASAVICVPDDDLKSMETALLVRRVRPDVRLVVRMDNSAVGRALAEATGEDSVLDVAALAAPAVVEACRGARPRRMVLAGQTFLAADLTVDRPATLRELYGELAPIALSRAGTETLLCPGRDTAVQPGDRVTAIGTPAEFVARHVPHIPPEPDARARRAAGTRSASAARAVELEEYGGPPGARTLLRSLIAEADRPLRTTLLTLVSLVVLSVLVLQFGYVKPDGSHMTVLDALYFTVETIATVGYGDFSFAHQAPWLRAFAIALMFCGVVMAAIVFALLTELLVSTRLARSFGHRRAARTKGHVIVVGLGALALRVVQDLLAAGNRVVVVERDPDNPRLGQVRARGVPVVIADATYAAVLTNVNLGAAVAVAVLTSDDLVNIETGLAVRDQIGDRWREVPVVLRVFDRELGAAVHEGFGFRYVRSTEALVAPWFVGAALGLGVLGTFHVGQDAFLVGCLTVARGGGLEGTAMQELATARTRVIAIRRAGTGKMENPPRSGTRFAAGDEAYLVGPYVELLGVLRRDTLGRDAIASWPRPTPQSDGAGSPGTARPADPGPPEAAPARAPLWQG
ncbi:MAG: NAD-binding protein [Pseudonocardia sp.]|nr:NAD-binding protein [Pseudonocardia sp.]